ncbi:MAG: HEAT repeat domain-containing protein [Chloroflexota bacterium]|nr:HEAT repeat domain-containing protein [Chloroflexota bacterium]
MSSLSEGNIDQFNLAWASLSIDRKKKILDELTNLCELDIAMDFSQIFLIGISDKNSLIREASVVGLWESNDRMIIKPLTELLRDDPSNPVRQAAAMTLATFTRRSQEGKLIHRDYQQIRESLLHAIEDESSDIDTKRRSIETIAHFGSSGIEDIILNAHKGYDSKLRQSAIYAMGRTSETRWIKLLIESLDDPDPAIRYETASSLGELGDETIIPYLTELLTDDDTEVKASAIRSLGQIGGSSAKQTISDYLDDEDSIIKESAISAMKIIRFEENPLGFHENL